jgi:hypothetical protein
MRNFFMLSVDIINWTSCSFYFVEKLDLLSVKLQLTNVTFTLNVFHASRERSKRNSSVFHVNTLINSSLLKLLNLACCRCRVLY